MTWQIEFLEDAKNDLKKLDHSSQIQILKGIRKVSQNPLPTFQGGYGRPLISSIGILPPSHFVAVNGVTVDRKMKGHRRIIRIDDRAVPLFLYSTYSSSPTISSYSAASSISSNASDTISNSSSSSIFSRFGCPSASSE